MNETRTADKTGIETDSFKKMTHGTPGKHLIARERADSYSMPLLRKGPLCEREAVHFAAVGKHTTEDDSILH